MTGTSCRCSASQRIEREIRAPASSPFASFVSSICVTGGTVTARYCVGDRGAQLRVVDDDPAPLLRVRRVRRVAARSRCTPARPPRSTGRARSSRRRTAFVVVSRWSISSRWSNPVRAPLIAPPLADRRSRRACTPCAGEPGRRRSTRARRGASRTRRSARRESRAAAAAVPAAASKLDDLEVGAVGARRGRAARRARRRPGSAPGASRDGAAGRAGEQRDAAAPRRHRPGAAACRGRRRRSGGRRRACGSRAGRSRRERGRDRPEPRRRDAARSGCPQRSSSTVSCTLYAVHEPQSAAPVITTSASARSRSKTSGAHGIAAFAERPPGPFFTTRLTRRAGAAPRALPASTGHQRRRRSACRCRAPRCDSRARSPTGGRRARVVGASTSPSGR